MALNLRKAVVRNAGVNFILCFAISMVLGFVGGGMKFSLANLVWPLTLALGIGLFTGWQTMAGIRKNVLKGVGQVFSYIRLERAAEINGIRVDWETLDDYAAQLATRGYSRLGEYRPYPVSGQFTGIVACFLDASTSTIIEVQQIQMLKTASSAALPNLSGVHFSILTIMGGSIRVATTDHVPLASNFLIRGDHDVVATYPGLPLLSLLENHQRTLESLRQRTGKTPSIGMTMPRYVFQMREKSLRARQRLERMSGYAIVQEIDAFEADPAGSWAPSADVLAALPVTSLEDLDTSVVARGQPPVIDAALADAAVAATAPAALAPAAVNGVDSDMLRRRVESGANWFYWIAGLSLVNIVVGALGSKWGFAIGLGLSQLLTGIAISLRDGTTSYPVLIGLLWLASIVFTLFFAACGWFSRRPSMVAFVAGFAVFLLDSLIFLLASDWIGLAFHGLALYFIWGGMAAARRLRQQAAKCAIDAALTPAIEDGAKGP